MLTVPLAIAGALIFMYAGGITMNIFSQIGIIMLIGLVAKNGILIVEFANQKQEGGENKMCHPGCRITALAPYSNDKCLYCTRTDSTGIRNRRRRQSTHRHGYGCCGRNVSIHFAYYVYRTGYL